MRKCKCGALAVNENTASRRGGADFYLRAADYVLGSTGPSYAPAASAFVSGRESERALHTLSIRTGSAALALSFYAL